MAPRKEKKEEKKKPEPKTEAPKTLRAKGYVAFTGNNDFRGRLVDRGRHVQCLLPLLRPDPNEPNRTVCGAVVQNEKRHIQSHLGRHTEGSARSRDTKKDPSRPWKCPCGKDHANWTSHWQHIRYYHGVRGKSGPIREAGGLKKFGAKLDPKTGQVREKREDDNDDNAAAAAAEDDADEDDEDEDEGVFVPPPQDGPQDPKYDDDDHDGGFGPSGAAGGLIEATA